jgi:hypothetical protein
MNYTSRANNYAEGDSLRYEKRMLDDWFKKEIAPASEGKR